MTKIITSSETDIELDPESLTDTDNIKENIKTKRLEAIRDLEALLDNPDSLYVSNITSEIKEKKEEHQVNCVIKFESRLTKNTFATYVHLNGLNQTIVDRSITEVELIGDDKKLIQLFSFYQNNIYKQKRCKKGSVRIFLQRKNVIKKRRRNVLTKNDVFVTKFYAFIKNKKINLLDLQQYVWKVNELKYAFDNNRSTIKILLVRSK